ncbi:MAG: PAS domain S-box protein, partial [Rhizobiales bacterium]|nr:PAS domain S-box protein [Hyphomicrobiales bacterium]
VEVRLADGAHRPVEARLHMVPWSDVTAMMLTLSVPAADAPGEDDVADDLADRVSELEAILDTATDGVVLIEGDGRIAGLNHTAEALFGVESRAVVGAPFTDLLAEESRRAAVDYIDGLSANGVASVLNDGREVIGKAPRGGLIPLFMTIGRLGESGKFCAVLRDITHWKNVEVELVAARRTAEAANAQKSEFLAKISHEIRTPLNAIIGFSEVMMEERFGPIGSERYRSYLRDIHVSGEHLMSLINDLLDLSKVEAGKLDLNFEAVSLNEVIRDAVALMQPQANRERVIIRTSLSTSLPNVVADIRSLRQILLNLLSNAVKFTRSGGQVIVATALEEHGEVVIRIRDTGIGMSPSDVETALKPFRQVASSGRAREGTGLGLPLTKALVEANRASFAIDSVPNQGTLVRVTFPTTRVLAG